MYIGTQKEIRWWEVGRLNLRSRQIHCRLIVGFWNVAPDQDFRYVLNIKNGGGVGSRWLLAQAKFFLACNYVVPVPSSLFEKCTNSLQRKAGGLFWVRPSKYVLTAIGNIL